MTDLIKTIRRYLAVVTFILSHILLILTARLDKDVAEYAVGLLMLNIAEKEHGKDT